MAFAITAAGCDAAMPAAISTAEAISDRSTDLFFIKRLKLFTPILIVSAADIRSREISALAVKEEGGGHIAGLEDRHVVGVFNDGVCDAFFADDVRGAVLR